jgi:hypothetical protein
VIPDALTPWLAIAALSVALVSLGVSLLGRRRRGRPSTVLAATPEEALAAETERIDRLAQQLAQLARRFDAAEAQGQRSMQRVGVVRYNPFDDTGSNQSFVLAVLDARGDGFVLSSLHSRQQTRSFLKAVSAGKAEAAISQEEAEAIRLALAR